jgi:hypothetical protein
MLLLPMVFLGILALSYQHYHKLNNSSCCWGNAHSCRKNHRWVYRNFPCG